MNLLGKGLSVSVQQVLSRPRLLSGLPSAEGVGVEGYIDRKAIDDIVADGMRNSIST